MLFSNQVEFRDLFTNIKLLAKGAADLISYYKNVEVVVVKGEIVNYFSLLHLTKQKTSKKI